MLNRKLKSTSGFSLTEVMIGIMILTVAIVSASNLLVSMVQTNRLNVQSLQAYFLAQEGIEAVRNIRDTNWLHNLDFRGGGGVYAELEENRYYSVFLDENGWRNSGAVENVSSPVQLSTMKPWTFNELPYVPYNQSFGLMKDEFGGYIADAGSSDDPVFYRYIQVLDACENDSVLDASLIGDECDDFLLIRSVVEWKDGSRDRKVALEAVLSNWKGGAL
ncbi:MAG: prepilin-type N-terminal cleavage/methylation domain-containing protein [Nitrospirae bacterium]|nr:prepilin-type N-terminal cleavage/methylation domain-containing protein [Nitrospirota bacterium]